MRPSHHGFIHSTFSTFALPSPRITSTSSVGLLSSDSTPPSADGPTAILCLERCSYISAFSFWLLHREHGIPSCPWTLALDEVDGRVPGCPESKMAAKDLATVEDPQLTLDLKYVRQPAGCICREMLK